MQPKDDISAKYVGGLIKLNRETRVSSATVARVRNCNQPPPQAKAQLFVILPFDPDFEVASTNPFRRQSGHIIGTLL